MKFPVLDLHCDTALAMLSFNRQPGSQLRSNKLHIDLERASTLDGYCQCFACFTTPQMLQWYHKPPVEIFEREMAVIMNEVERNCDKIAFAYNASDIRQNQEKGLMSAFLTLEGTAGFGFDPELLGDMHQAGFRITSLGWNEKNDLTGSHQTGGGLTDQGRVYVREAQRLGMIVDVSHISDEAFWDIMDITEAPVIATHSNSRAVFGESRNLTDDMFREIMKTGGVAGLNLYTGFIGEHADVDKACDHIFHFLELDPDGTHIALGGDLDGCESLPEGIDGIQDYPRIVRRLLERGLDEKTVYNIFWNNALGVIEKCCM
ncbi:MAG: membrane dipeptidase [Oscillospiraceae bacterium]|nr:membrane dipeptidase [Oscillospiraceae bacterium]